MKKKVLGIFVCTLLIATTFPAIGFKIDTEFYSNNIDRCNQVKYIDSNPPQLSSVWWLGVDQEQKGHCGQGFQIRPPYWFAQEFKPTKEKLIGIELWMFKYNNTPSGLKINVSIRDSLDGNDLAMTTIDADIISDKGTWVLFNFDDITVTPEQIYYIVCWGGGGDDENAYCWIFNANNSYNRGKAWRSWDNGKTWTDLEDYSQTHPEIDFCFKTYHSKSKNKSFNLHIHLLKWLFERFPNAFPIFRHILGI